MSIILEEEQQKAVDAILAWWKDPDRKQLFTLTGYAGTGKTTIIKFAMEQLHLSRVAFGAFTGKAAGVIQENSGYPASTIHSLIYSYIRPDKELCDELHEKLYGEEAVADIGLRETLETQLKNASAPTFAINDESIVPNLDCLLLDECSMVNQEMLDDLLEFGTPVIALGDPGQLSPIEGTGAVFVNPADIHLTKIHRQAEGNTIIMASTRARQGIPQKDTALTDKEGFEQAPYLPHSPDSLSILTAAGQVLCGRNDTRATLNMRIRAALGFDVMNPYPQVGERICCWRNDKEKKLFNGQQMVVVKVGQLLDLSLELYVCPVGEEDVEPIKVNVLRAYFDEYMELGVLKQVKWWERKGTQEFDFGYAITVHKAQGSQWHNVVLVDDGLFRGWRGKSKERNRFLYTAITRAAKKMTILRA